MGRNSPGNSHDIADNREVVRRLMEEVLAGGDIGLIPELVGADYVAHLEIGDQYGPEGVRIDVAAYRTAFPDLAVTLDDLLVDGDKVVRRFTLRGTHHRPFLGIPASDRPVVLRSAGATYLDNPWRHDGDGAAYDVDPCPSGVANRPSRGAAIRIGGG